MFKQILFCSLVLSFACTPKQKAKIFEPQNWTHYVRTAGHGLDKSNINATIQEAMATNLYGIEVDNDITGRYESFLDPTGKLETLRLMSSLAHKTGNYVFVYVAGLECITAHADTAKLTFFIDHPDWVQRDIHNHPAMFGGGDAFWISKGDEDVWISPYAPEWRKIYLERIRQITATGVDGIYVDIPYWMTHFEGWENTWASFDDYTVQAFKEKTGLDARKDLRLGDFSDSNFRKWVDFRMESLTRFMADITQTVKSVNPECQTIAEIYPGIGEEAVRVGADVYALYPVVDVITHEFSGGQGNAADMNPLEWFQRMVGMYTFRAFAEGKASWMLSYSWQQKNTMDPREPMKNLALSNLMAGTNCWDAQGFVMSGSNDLETRTVINRWIATNDSIFYKPRHPISPVGIYFSPATRNYFADSFIASYQGIMQMMLQGHLEFQVVTPRTLKDFKGKLLILPDVKCVSQVEESLFENYLSAGNGLVITGESGRYDSNGEEYRENKWFTFLHISPLEEKIYSAKDQRKFIYYRQCPGKIYSGKIRDEFSDAASKAIFLGKDFFTFLTQFKHELDSCFNLIPGISLEASPFVSAQISMVDGKPSVFLANYAGLKSDEMAQQIPENGIVIHFIGTKNAKVYYLPFLGETQLLESRYQDGKIHCRLPPLQKGGVVWMEN